MFTLATWPKEIVLLNELVLLKELVLKESMLFEELLLSPTRDCDIPLFVTLWSGRFGLLCGGFGEWVLE